MSVGKWLQMGIAICSRKTTFYIFGFTSGSDLLVHVTIISLSPQVGGVAYPFSSRVPFHTGQHTRDVIVIFRQDGGDEEFGDFVNAMMVNGTGPASAKHTTNPVTHHMVQLIVLLHLYLFTLDPS